MEQFLTTHEAAKMVGVTPVTIRMWIKKGYLGDTDKQSVTTGTGCGYKIRLSDLNRHVHGWTVEESAPNPEPKPKQKAVDPRTLIVDKESMRLAVNNLRIAIEFCQEELSKIEALL